MSPHVLRQEKVLKALWDFPEGARIKELVRTIYPSEIWEGDWSGPRVQA
jgi:hypothetical protein